MPLISTLGRKSDFIRIFQKGKRAYSLSLIMIGIKQTNQTDRPRFAFQLKKKLGSAVVRNRLRRQLKEIAAHLENTCLKWDIVISVRPCAVGQRYVDLEKEFKKGLSKLGCCR